MDLFFSTNIRQGIQKYLNPDMKETLTKLRNLFVYRPAIEDMKAIQPFREQTVTPQVDIPNEWIAERAFYIWQERGCSHGNDREDWILAKLQLEDELN